MSTTGKRRSAWSQYPSDNVAGSYRTARRPSSDRKTSPVPTRGTRTTATPDDFDFGDEADERNDGLNADDAIEVDDFDLDAEKEAEEYRVERANRMSDKRNKRTRKKKPTVQEIDADINKLCLLLDPSQEELPLDAAKALMERAYTAVSAQRKAIKDEGMSALEAKMVYDVDLDEDVDEASKFKEDPSDESKNVKNEPTLGDLRTIAEPTASTSTAGSLPQPRASGSTSRFRPLVERHEDVNVSQSDDGDEEEEDMLARRPQKPVVAAAGPLKQEQSDDEEEQVFTLGSASQRSGSQHAQSQRAIGKLPVKSEPNLSSDTEDEDEEEEEMVLSARFVKRGNSNGTTTDRKHFIKSETGEEKPKALQKRRSDYPIDVDMKPRFGLRPGQQPAGPLVLDDDSGVQVPAWINQHLRDYQREGINFLWSAYRDGRGCILGDDMGLGKTVQVIGFLAAIMKKTGGSRDLNRRIEALRLGRVDAKGKPNSVWPTCLILCPQTVLGNWQNELETWGYFEYAVYGSGYKGALESFERSRLDIVLASHEYARDHIASIKDLDWSCIFADEAHKFKNPVSQMTRSMNMFKCKARFGLSGTVIQNRMREMWTLLDWTNPGAFGSLMVWEQLVSDPIKLGQRKSATRKETADSRLIAELLTQNLQKAYMLRRTKALIADQLPKKYDKIVFCPLAPEQLQAYRKLYEEPDVKELRLADDPCECGRRDEEGRPYRRKKCCHDVPWHEILRIIYLMCCLANHAALFFPDPAEEFSPKEETRERYEMQCLYTKHLWPDRWRDLINNQRNGFRTALCGKWHVLVGLLRVWHKEKDKVLLFSRNLRLLDWLGYWLEHSGFNHLRLDGSTPQAQRQGKVDAFNRDPSTFIFLISTTAGGTGLNLTGANKVVIFDPNWNPAHDMQAMDRAYRFGQTRDVYVYRLIGAGTIEEIIYGRQMYKSQAANIGYTASSERKFFQGVEGRREHKGELFGCKNLFTLREETCSITKEIIEDCDVGESAEEVRQLVAALGGSEKEKEVIEGAKIGYTHDHAMVMALPPSLPAANRGKRRKEEDNSDSEDEKKVRKSMVNKKKTTTTSPRRPAAVWPPPRARVKSE